MQQQQEVQQEMQESKDLELLFQDVFELAQEHELINGVEVDRKKQSLEVMSRFGELCDGVARNNEIKVKNSIGHIAFMSLILMKQMGEDFDFQYYRNRHKRKDDIDPFEVIEFGNSLKNMIYGTEFIELVFHRLNLIAKNYDMTLKHCLKSTYREIKRADKVVYQGVFYMRDDPRYNSILLKKHLQEMLRPTKLFNLNVLGKFDYRENIQIQVEARTLDEAIEKARKMVEQDKKVFPTLNVLQEHKSDVDITCVYQIENMTTANKSE